MKFEKLLSFFSNSKNIEVIHPVYWWLIVALVFLILEMGHPGLFFFISFFFGGLFAAGVSCFTDSIMHQVLTFFGSTMVALYILRHYAVGMIGKNRPHQPTNFYALKGQRATVTQTIMAEKAGLVSIGGQVWAARSTHSRETIASGDVVEVVDVRGAHVIVKKV